MASNGTSSDEHGQLFLSGTRMRNFTTCYKDPAFLDFFYSRLKPLPAPKTSQEEQRYQELRSKGYTFLSLCGIERNYVRSKDTPIVFHDLRKDAGTDQQGTQAWNLRYAGTLSHPFSPSSLKADDRGYFYHPSPRPPQRRKKAESHTAPTSNPYGGYSLIKSSLALARMSENLELIDSGEGEYTFEGKRYSIGKLDESEVTRGLGFID